jgi:hypothetical protein
MVFAAWNATCIRDTLYGRGSTGTTGQERIIRAFADRAAIGQSSGPAWPDRAACRSAGDRQAAAGRHRLSAGGHRSGARHPRARRDVDVDPGRHRAFVPRCWWTMAIRHNATRQSGAGTFTHNTKIEVPGRWCRWLILIFIGAFRCRSCSSSRRIPRPTWSRRPATSGTGAMNTPTTNRLLSVSCCSRGSTGRIRLCRGRLPAGDRHRDGRARRARPSWCR